MKQKEYITLIRSHTDSIMDASFDPVCKYIATASNDSTVRVWDYQNTRQLYDFNAPNETPTKLSFHPAQLEYADKSYSTLFACGFTSGKIRIFNVNEAKLMREIPCAHNHQTESAMKKYEITDLKYSCDGKRLISGDLMKYICLYDVDRDYTLVRMLPNCISVHGSLSISPDNRTFAVIGANDYLITVYESASLNEVLRIDTSVSNNTSSIQSFNNQTCSQLYDQSGMPEAILKLAYAPADMNQIICVTAANKLIKFDTKHGRLLSSVPRVHKNSTDSLCVTSDGRYLITSGDNLVKIWDYEMRFEKNFQVN